MKKYIGNQCRPKSDAINVASDWVCIVSLKDCISFKEIQSTLVISKSKGPSETLRDIRTSTYQICRTEENTNRTIIFHN